MEEIKLDEKATEKTKLSWVDKRVNEIVESAEKWGVKVKPEAKEKLKELVEEQNKYSSSVVVNWCQFQDERKRAERYGGTSLYGDTSACVPDSACGALYKMYTHEADLKKYLAKWLINACYIENICNTGEDTGMERAKQSAKFVAPCLYEKEEEKW